MARSSISSNAPFARGVVCRIALLASLLAAVTDTVAAGTAEPTPASLQRPLATWSQAEREYGFAHWSQVFPTRTVRRGAHVHEFAVGKPIPGFEPGGASAAALDRYAAEFKLAGLVVVENNAIRLEYYGLGHDAKHPWTSFSVAKSLTSTLVGAALKDGFIKSIEDPVTRYIPELGGAGYDGVTVRQLLTMTSGVKWNEDYTDLHSDVALFYSTPPDRGVDATVSYMRRLPREFPPGAKWVYKTGETNLLGVLVSRATGKPLATYLSEKIWSRYGMEADASWHLDVTKHEQGGCCFQATTRDFARVGEFILEGARIDGQSIVADGWLEAATRKQADIGVPDRGYGFQWWTRDDGTFDAIGIHGQLIHVDPARHIVVAMNSAWPVATGKDYSAARVQLLRLIIGSIEAAAGR